MSCKCIYLLTHVSVIHFYFVFIYTKKKKSKKIEKKSNFHKGQVLYIFIQIFVYLFLKKNNRRHNNVLIMVEFYHHHHHYWLIISIQIIIFVNWNYVSARPDFLMGRTKYGTVAEPTDLTTTKLFNEMKTIHNKHILQKLDNFTPLLTPQWQNVR